MRQLAIVASVVGLVGCVQEPEVTTVMSELGSFSHIPNRFPFKNSTGFSTTVSTEGSIDLSNEFFQDLGTNGRRCVSCHLPTAAWSVTPQQLQLVFWATYGGVYDDGFGLGAAFRLNDGANSPTADVSTFYKRKQAYSMLLTKGLIRVSMPVPADAEFELIEVDDPYDHSSAADLSMFRRPLPTTNLKFLSTVMWDGRETTGGAIHFDLANQSSGATTGHAEGEPLSQAQRESIVDFETALHSAQYWDKKAKSLTAKGADGGPDAIIDQEFYIGINDNFGDSQTGDPFTPIVFDIYDAWDDTPGGGTNKYRRAVARGQALFNTREINISGVGGLNDEAAFGFPANVVGTCTTCHNSPNAGDHSVVAPLDIGLVDESQRTSDLPLYTFRNKTTQEIRRVTDPGRAMISGKWKDLGKFKGPILRDLAARPPYFHNGSAETLGDAVDFYDQRFGMNLTWQERSDLVAFLQTL
jgi:cytochrome c peroxidase